MPLLRHRHQDVLYYKDHAPPHFHAEYADRELVVGMAPIAILAGEAPTRVRSMVFEWAALHQQELRDNWQRCQSAQPAERIEPLE